MNTQGFLLPHSAAAGEHSAPVTHVGQRILWTIVTLAVIAGIYLLMWRGWKNRQARQANVPPLPDFDPSYQAFEEIEAVYVSTTSAGDWLDRIAVHGLGERSQALVVDGNVGLWIQREPFGAPDIYIPAGAIEKVALTTGMAGKYLGEEGIVVVTWRHGDHVLDTGLKPRHEADRAILVARVERMTNDLAALRSSHAKGNRR